MAALLMFRGVVGSDCQVAEGNSIDCPRVFEPGYLTIDLNGMIGYLVLVSLGLTAFEDSMPLLFI